MGDEVVDGSIARGASRHPNGSRTSTRMIWQALAIAGGWVPLSIAASQSVALRTDELGARSAIYSLMVATGWAVSMASLPTMGHLADRAIRRDVDQRVLVILGGLGMIGCFALLGLAESVPVFALAWLLAQIPTALIVTASSSRLAYEAPARLRGRASTLAGMAPVVAIAFGAATTLAFSATPSALFIAPAIVGALLLIPSLITRPLDVVMPDRTDGRSPTDARLTPWTLLITIALAFSGLAVGRIYLVPLVESLSQGSSEETVTALSSSVLLLATLGAIVGTIVSGRILRSEERSLSTFAWFALASALPLIGLALAAGVGQVLIIGTVFGFVIGAINASTYGIFLHRYAERDDRARILGIFVAAETTPYVIVPLLAAISQSLSDDAMLPALFLGGAAFTLAAWAMAMSRGRRSKRWNDEAS